MLTVVNVFLKLTSNIKLINRSKHKYKSLLNMDKAYLRYTGEENDQFELGFKYVNEELKVDRQFNFCRKLSENVDSFLTRVVTNVEKALTKKKKSADNEENLKVGVTLLLNDNQIPKDAVCREVFQPGNNVLLKVKDTAYQVIINSPWVNSISLPNCIMAGFPVYPNKFESSSTDKSLSKFVWAKSLDKKAWTDVGDQYIYIPQNEDICHYLKLSCIPMNSQFEGPRIEIESNSKVEASPGRCPFENRHEFTRARPAGKEFRVISYNILADLYCDSDHTREVLFPYCPPYALAIDYRKNLFVKEIIGYNADIICLQEVDRKIFHHDLEPTLSHLGYSSNFFTKGGEVAEGLAFFCKADRFQILESHRVVFAEHISKDPIYADIWEKIAKNSKLAERILARTTTLSVNVIESLEHNEALIVANIHLYFHPNADHIRLLHGGLAIRFLEHFQEKIKEKIPDKRISLIFCGDFNSVPQCGIYKLFTTGSVPKDCVDYQSTEEQAVEDLELQQKFSLGSACGTPKYTNFTAGFTECLDYIYFEKHNLEVTQVIPFPSDEELTQNTALPSVVFPSDHIALISDMKWT